jgi:hypothetical protein
MSITTAILLACVSGFVTGVMAARISDQRAATTGLGVAGAILAAVVFGLFFILDFLILPFGDVPSPALALLLTIGLEVLVLIVLAFTAFALPAIPPAKRNQWLLGGAAAALLVIAGIIAVEGGEARIGSTFFSQKITGWRASLYGIGWIAIGLFLHLRYFWRDERASTAALAVGCLCILAVFFSA